MANDRLTAYKAKRDFQKTREPSGQDAVKPTTRRRLSSRSTTLPAFTTICGSSWMAFSNPGR
jgi:hypothetical protein